MKKFYGRVKSLLGLELLSADFKKFSAVHFCFLIFTTIIGVFINTLLFRQASVYAAILYNLLIFSFQPFFMLFAAALLSKRAKSFGIFATIGLYFINIGIILLFLNDIGRLMPQTPSTVWTIEVF